MTARERDDEIRALRKRGKSLRAIARRFGLSHERVRQIVLGLMRPRVLDPLSKREAGRLGGLAGKGVSKDVPREHFREMQKKSTATRHAGSKPGEKRKKQMTITERLDAARRRAADELAAIEAEAALVPLLSIEPTYIHFANKPEPWVKYDVLDITAALAIFASFPAIAAGSAVDAGCLYVGPHARENAGGGTTRWEADQLVEVCLERGRGYGANTLSWWAPLGDRLARVRVEIKEWPWKAAPSCRVTYDSHGGVSSARHELQALGEWRRVKWGAGGMDLDSCRFSLYFDSREAAAKWLEGITEVHIPLVDALLESVRGRK